MASANLSLKLTIYTKGNKVLFAEAGKNVVDFLFSIFSLSVGTVVRLLKKQEIVGALGNLCQSIEDLDDIYMQPDETKDNLLMPKIATPASEVPLLLLNVESTEKTLYSCSHGRYTSCHIYVSDDPSLSCGACNNRMKTPATYLKNPNKVASSTEGGLVKGAVTYMMMDDLVVKPMSTTSIVTILSKFNVKDVSALEEKEVTLSMDEGLKLLNASLSAKNVLTDVFLA